MTEEQKSPTSSSPSSERTQRSSSSRSDSSKSDPRVKKRPASKSSERSSETTTKRRPKPKLAASKAVVAAIEQLQLLTTRAPESVVGVTAHNDGWRVIVEVVESARIPNTADIMAEYEVDIDGNGDLAGYTRKSRYFRGRTQGE